MFLFFAFLSLHGDGEIRKEEEEEERLVIKEMFLIAFTLDSHDFVFLI